MEKTGELRFFEEEPRIWNISIEKIRLILMFFACINLFGLPFDPGGYIRMVCGFVAPAFFVISGFLVLQDSADRSAKIARAIKRTAIVFLLLTVFYTAANVIYGEIGGVDVFASFSEKGTWFNFLALNVWPLPIGGAIWYVQALLYAYIILFVLEKCKLLRFDWVLMLILFVFTLWSGELSALFGFKMFGLDFLPGNFLTRALPYLLLGGFIARKTETFSFIHPVMYYLSIAFGVFLVVAEIFILQSADLMPYHGHFVGMIVLAPAVCIFSFLMPGKGFLTPFLDWFASFGTNWIYYICPVVSFVLTEWFSAIDPEADDALRFVGLLTFAVSMILVLLGSLLWTFILNKIRPVAGNEGN